MKKNTSSSAGTIQQIIPHQSRSILSEVEQKAQRILNHNLVLVKHHGKTYCRTVPSKQYYTHQWNWDSATVAMGLVHFHPQAAYDELRALISGQWENGLIAHITYNPDEELYYPQADKWRTQQFWQNGVPTSGITQPPVFAIGVEYVYDHSPDKQAAEAFLEEMLPAIIRFHEHLKTYRDPEDKGLMTIIHSWESGTDNSPRWDSVYAHVDLDKIPQSVKEDVNLHRVDDQIGEVSHRPTRENYYRFMGLIDMYAKWDWDYHKIVARSPFAVKDILFSSIWARANESLARLLKKVGRYEEAALYKEWAKQTKQAIAGTWDAEKKQYTDIDVSQGRKEKIAEPTIATFVPLWAEAVTDTQLPKLIENLTDPKTFWTPYPIPSTAINSPKFEIARYWRGPTWPITNMFIIEGLLRYKDRHPKAEQLAEQLIDSTLEMMIQNDFYEYYDPTHGKGEKFNQKEIKEPTLHFGFADFSWSAAIFISLYERYRKH
ncbi:MAG: trehalase family glycosidase [Patescibacteria group bacterium]